MSNEQSGTWETRPSALKEGTHLDFLGYQFRYDHDLYGRGKRYLNWGPSPKSVQRERAKLTEMTASRQGCKPIPTLIDELNRHLKGWLNYFSLGYPRRVFHAIGHHVRSRMIRHLRRRSQRPFRIPEGSTWYGYLAELGLLNPSLVSVNSLRTPAAKVSGNAGCGKPARPV